MKHSQQVNRHNSELFDQYLVEFQEDIRRVVGKFKKSFHALSDEEIYSECNLLLLKNKQKILDSFPDDEDFNQSEFKKIAYHYVKNESVWTHYRFMNKSYNRRKLDGVTQTEDGVKTVFEAAIETQGEENHEIDNDEAFFTSNSKRFFHILTKYCYLLTEKECRLLSFYQKGLSQIKIAEELEVTHQAISTMFLGIKEKLNQFFNSEDVFNGGNFKDIAKGEQSMNSFFDKGLEDPVIHSSDKKKIQNFILKSSKTFSGKEINKILFNNKYSLPKITGAIRSLKLTTLIRSSNRRYLETEKQTVSRLYQKGLSPKEVARKTGICITCCQRLRAELVKNGLLFPLRKKSKKNIQQPIV